MSASSFPRAEHVALLRQQIENLIRLRGQRIEVTERGLHHLKCQYKFGLRKRPEDEWLELAIHFQSADRFERTAKAAELDRLINEFLNRHFLPGEA